MSQLIEAVSHGYDPCRWRYLSAWKSAVVPLAVNAFVVRRHGWDDVVKGGDPGKDPLRIVGVKAYLLGGSLR
jgi:hypothetical protein